MSKMISHRASCRLLAGVALIPLFTALPAHAQATGQSGVIAPNAATAAAGDDRSSETIIVTGSRIGRSGFAAPSPTTVLGRTDIEKRGFTNIGQITNAIPSFLAVTTPAATSLTSARAGGNYLNLRGLGDLRTLTLVNNRRVVPSNPEGSVDTNIIPSALMQRIDVVTGGASAAYGSDAIAGVVNIILRESLEGFVGNVQSGVSQRGDAESYQGSLAWGTKFAGGRGNFIIAAEGETNKGIGFQTTRDWGRSSFAPITVGGTPPTKVLPNAQFALQTLGGLVTRGALAGTDFGPGGVPRQFVSGPSDGFFQSGGNGVNAADFVSLSVPYDRYSLYGKADYDLGGARLFVDASYAYSRGSANVVPASNFGSLTIQQDNAFLDPGLRTRLLAAGQTSFNMGRFSLDYGVLTSELTNRTTRITAGIDGTLGSSWKWNVYGQYGHNNSDTNRGNNAILARLGRSVDAVAGSAGPACRVNTNASTADDDPACVPVNLFGNGSPSQAAKAYFLGVSEFNTKFTQYVASGSINGDLFTINDKPVTVAFGGEYRSEKVVGVADPISQANGFAFGNPKSLSGSRDVVEGFAEILVPLLHDVAFAKALDFNGAVRLTNYTGTGTVTTWKAGATWDINDSIRVRGTLSRDIRAPNLSELFATSNTLFATVTDRGVTGPVEFVSGGNPNLQAEFADTWSAGVVLTPSFAPGLRLSADYFDIRIDDAITTVPAQVIVNLCAAGNDALCAFLVRDASGRLIRINASQVNASRLETSGVDLELDYSFDLGGGSTFNIRGLGTYVDKFALTNRGITIDRAGEVGGNNNGMPNWRFNLSTTYNAGPLTLFAEGRYVGGGKYDNTLGPDKIDLVDIKGRYNVNTSVQYAIIDTDTQRFQLFFNINNLFDTDPPITPSSFIAPPQANAVLYDVVGRAVQVGARFSY
jgi:outer membrane receptor protein involved in Fe transport